MPQDSASWFFDVWSVCFRLLFVEVGAVTSPYLMKGCVVKITRVLFVDDDSRTLNSLMRVLRKYIDGWIFYYAKSADEAQEILKIEDIDVCITDMYMPVTNGLDLLKFIESKYPNVTRVMMTASVDLTTQKKAMSVSQYFLWKPVEIGAIRTILQLVSHNEMDSTPLRVGC